MTTFAHVVFHKEDDPLQIYSLCDFYYNPEDIKDTKLIPFFQTFFHAVLKCFSIGRWNLIVDIQSLDRYEQEYEKQYFLTNILHHRYHFFPNEPEHTFVLVDPAYPSYYTPTSNRIPLTLSTSQKTLIDIRSLFTKKSLLDFIPSNTSVQDTSQPATSDPNTVATNETTESLLPLPAFPQYPKVTISGIAPLQNIPKPANIPLSTDKIQKLRTSAFTSINLVVRNPDYPALSSDKKVLTATRFIHILPTQVPDYLLDTYVQFLPRSKQQDLYTSLLSNTDITTKRECISKAITEYQSSVQTHLKKETEKLNQYLTTPSVPHVAISQDKKGLVYAISIPNRVPKSFMNTKGKFMLPEKYHFLSATDKIHALSTLQSRMQNFHEIIHHDLLTLANNPFLGKAYSPTAASKTYSSDEILQLCLNTATHPDAWQLAGRKLLALHLQNPNDKNPKLDILLRNATAGSGSQVDYHFPNDLISKLYCTTVSNNRLRYMLTDHVSGSLGSILGRRITGSLILLWLYAPLLTDHPSESSIKERAGFLTYIYPPDPLKDFLRDIRQFDSPEVELLPSEDEYSLIYTFPLQYFRGKLSRSSHDITRIWQNIRVLVCSLAFLTNPTTFQTKITTKATDLYSDIYYSTFKVLQEQIVTESPKSITIPCSLSSLLLFSAEDPIMPTIWSQWLQFFMILLANSRQFAKPAILDAMLKNLYTNYPRIKRGTILRPAQVLPQPQPSPPPASTRDIANDDDGTLAAIAFGFSDIEEPSPTDTDTSSPSSVYEWKPQLHGIINYDKKHTVLNFGTNEAYSDPHAFMSVFFVNPHTDVWRTYTYTTKSKTDGTHILVDSDLLYFDLVEKGLTKISDHSQLESLKQAFQHGQPLIFPPLPDTEKYFHHSPLTIFPNDVLGIMLRLPTTPTPHNTSDWQFTYFQLQGVNPLYTLLSEREFNKRLYHRNFQFPILRWSRPATNNLPTFHFGLEYTSYTNITLTEQRSPLTTSRSTGSRLKKRLKPTEIVVPLAYAISIDQGVRNPISFKIRKLPNSIDTQTLNFATLDDTLRNESVRETLGSGFIGHATPKGSTVSEPALLTAKDGIITTISSSKIDVLSRGIIEEKSLTPQTTDTAAPVVSFAIAASNQNLDHGYIQYKNVSQSLPHSQLLPEVSGYKLRNVLDKNGKKQDNSKDNPKTKPEAWLYHLIRIQARLDDRYIEISLKHQIVSMLMDLYKFINPSHQKLS